LGLVDALAVASAVVRARLGNKDSGDKASTHVHSGSSAVSILTALTRLEGLSGASSASCTPATEETIGISELEAIRAIGSGKVTTQLGLGNSLVAGSTGEVGSTVSTQGACAGVATSDTGTMTAAIITIIVALVGYLATGAAADGVWVDGSGIAIANTSGLIAFALATAVHLHSGARNDNALAVASDEVTLRVRLVK